MAWGGVVVLGLQKRRGFSSKLLGQLLGLGDGVGVGWRKVLGPVWVGGWTNDFATPPSAIWPEIFLRPAPGRRDLHRKTPAPVWPKSRSFGRDALAMDAGLRENRAMAVGTDGSLSTIPGDPAGKSIAGTSSPLCSGSGGPQCRHHSGRGDRKGEIVSPRGQS